MSNDEWGASFIKLLGVNMSVLKAVPIALGSAAGAAVAADGAAAAGEAGELAQRLFGCRRHSPLLLVLSACTVQAAGYFLGSHFSTRTSTISLT